MTDNKNDVRLSIARWANESTGALTDSLVFINDTGDIISPAPIQATGFVLENSNGQTLFLANSESQEFGIGALTFPATLGTQHQYLRIQNNPSFSQDTVMEWANGDGGGTVTSITAGLGLTGGVITGVGTIALEDTTVTAGSYSYANIATNAQGRLTAATPGFVNTNGVGDSDTVGFEDLNGINGVVINTTAVTVNSIINVTRNVGTSGLPDVMTIGNLIVGSIINNSSFTVYSTVNGDVGNINWSIINP